MWGIDGRGESGKTISEAIAESRQDTTTFRKRSGGDGEVVTVDTWYSFSHSWGICLKTPIGCLKLWIALNPMYTMIFPYMYMHTYDKV